MTWRPKPHLNSWQQLSRDGKFNVSERGLFAVLRSALWRLPNVTYPLGEKRYWESVDKHGEQNWKAPHNLWRAAWHLLFSFTLVGAYFGLENEVKSGWIGAKSRFDIITFLVGSWIVWILVLLLALY